METEGIQEQSTKVIDEINKWKIEPSSVKTTT